MGKGSKVSISLSRVPNSVLDLSGIDLLKTPPQPPKLGDDNKGA